MHPSRERRPNSNMAERMIAYCGLVCSECPAYIATQADDMEALARVAAQWSEEYNAEFTAQNCICDGCTSDGRLSSYAASGGCPVRVCAVERGVINCAYCDDYGCDKITHFFSFATEAKTTLEEIRQAL
jgi:hypothetical protein